MTDREPDESDSQHGSIYAVAAFAACVFIWLIITRA